MKKPSFTLGLIALGVLTLPFPAALAQEGIPTVLQEVRRWHLTFDYEETAGVTDEDEDWALNITASGSAVLVRSDDPDSYGEWIGTPSVNVSYSHIGWHQVADTCDEDEEIIGSGSPINLENSSWLRFFADGYQFDPASHRIAVSDLFRLRCPDEKITQLMSTRDWMGFAAIKDSIPYPTEGTTLQGTIKAEDSANPEDTITGVAVPSQVTLNYMLTPEMDDLRLEIDDGGGYPDWRPTLAADQGPGAPLEVRAQLVTESGDKPPLQVERFIWTLRDTSREPGIAMNFPAEAEDDDFDLVLEATPGDGGEVTDDGQELERLLLSGGHTDTARIVPRDWGGWATLEVRAILTNGKEIAGKPKSLDEFGLRLPKRDRDSFIADVWKKNVSGADDADDDAQPAGDGNNGDGLSLYQEYRGFYENGVHVLGDPQQKDFFAMAAEPARAGVATFALLSGLAVHGRLDSTELPQSRIINGNRSAGPGATEQHAIVIFIADGTSTGQPAATERRDPLGQAVGGPSTPKNISEVRLMGNWSTLPQDVRAQVVAHELLHSVNVYHHGDSDQIVAWGINASGKVAELSASGETQISVYNEPNQDATESWRKLLSMPPHDQTPPLGWVGYEGGQHSGDDQCVMRYFNAAAYRGNPDVTRRYRIREEHGSGLCASAVGTGVNDAAREPQSRYGNAASGRGDCEHQILVNDAVEPPSR